MSNRDYKRLTDKAMLIRDFDNGVSVLLSYETEVATFNHADHTVIRTWDSSSVTTARHYRQALEYMGWKGVAFGKLPFNEQVSAETGKAVA